MHLLIALFLSALLSIRLFVEKHSINAENIRRHEHKKTINDYTNNLKLNYCDEDLETKMSGDSNKTRDFLFNKFGIEEGLKTYSTMVDLLQNKKLPAWIIDEGLRTPARDKYWHPIALPTKDRMRLTYDIRYIHCVDFMMWYQDRIHESIDSNINIRFVEFDKSVFRTTKNSIDIYELNKVAHDGYKVDGVFFIEGTTECNTSAHMFSISS